MKAVTRAIIAATAVSGSLDLLSAFAFSAVKSVGPIRVGQSVASGPFGPGMMNGGVPAALLGILVHYLLMSVMVDVFVLGGMRLFFVRKRPLLSGLIYGFGIYLVMYWIILPLRWPGAFPKTGLWDVGNALFSHLICVGLPMGYVVNRALKPDERG